MCTTKKWHIVIYGVESWNGTVLFVGEFMDWGGVEWDSNFEWPGRLHLGIPDQI